MICQGRSLEFTEGACHSWCSSCQTIDSTSKQRYIIGLFCWVAVIVKVLLKVVVAGKTGFHILLVLRLRLVCLVLLLELFILPVIFEWILRLTVSTTAYSHSTANDLHSISLIAISFSSSLVTTSKGLCFFILSPVTTSIGQANSLDIRLWISHLDISRNIFQRSWHYAINFTVYFERQPQDRCLSHHELIVS